MASENHCKHGVAKHKNRVIQDMAHSTPKHKKGSDEFRAKVVNHVFQLINKIRTKAVWKKTPEEEWTGMKPTMKHLCTFRSTTQYSTTRQRLA